MHPWCFHPHHNLVAVVLLIDFLKEPTRSFPIVAFIDVHAFKQKPNYNSQKPVWELESNGIFSTKSAYLKLKEIKEYETKAFSGEVSDKRRMEQFWSKVWKLKIQGKVKIFLWRLYHDYLPSAQNLMRRGCEVDLRCRVCGFSVESSEHVIVDCWWARSFWDRIGLKGTFQELVLTNTADIIWWCVNSLNTDELVLFSYGARTIWYNRNLLDQGKEGLDLEAACNSTRALAEHFNKPRFRFTISEWEGGQKWEAPLKPYIKLNSDGAWEIGSKVAGFSVVSRDEEGLVIGVIAGSIPHLESALEAEGVAVLKAMNWAQQEGITHCIFEIDNAEVFSILSLRNRPTVSLPDWAQKCRILLCNNEEWRLSLIGREANYCADGLAKMACYKGWSWTSAHSLPRLPGCFP